MACSEFFCKAIFRSESEIHADVCCSQRFLKIWLFSASNIVSFFLFKGKHKLSWPQCIMVSTSDRWTGEAIFFTDMYFSEF